jgi:hypothetical protein
MRKCDLESGSLKIRHALEALQENWQNTTDHWDDAVSRHFQEHHLDPIVPRVKIALDAMGRMQQLVDEIQKDCES